MAPDGRVTAFSVGAYGTYPAKHWIKPKTAVCGVNVMEAAAFGPSRWGGMAVAPNDDVYVSDKQYHMVLRLRADGQVEHVAGGGDLACGYDRWKDRNARFGPR